MEHITQWLSQLYGDLDADQRAYAWSLQDKRTHWFSSDELPQAAEWVASPEDVSERGGTLSVLREFCAEYPPGLLPPPGQPFVRDGRVWVHLDTFRRYCASIDFALERGTLIQRLHGWGVIHTTIAVRAGPARSTTRAMYGVPRAITHQLALEAEHWGGENVVALSHTRAAAQEIAGRDHSLPDHNIGTLHAMAYRALGRPEVADEPSRLAEFAEEHPDWSPSAPAPDADPWDEPDGQRVAALREYSRLRNLMTPRAQWPQHILAFARDWEAWKGRHGLIDYTDMIDDALRGFPAMPSTPHTIVCDEMQDLSRLQYALLRQWGGAAERVITAGDQDQCIYQFSGADPDIFATHLPVAQKVLSQSWRVPSAVHEAAVAWIEQIPDRVPVSYAPRDYPGYLERTNAAWQRPQALIPSLMEHLGNGHTAMVMAACTYMLRPLVTELRGQAIPFGNPWAPDAPGGCNPLGAPHAQVAGQLVTPYALALVESRGLAALTERPRLYVGTIHSFKGAEADHVFLMPDLSRAGMAAYSGSDRATVVRQFYVGMTRARLGLTLCAPSGHWAVR